MTQELMSTILDTAAIILTVFIIVRIAPKIGIEKSSMPSTLFLFAIVTLLFVYIYWFAYTLMRPDSRMPFAANEIGENAAFLLLAAMLETVFREQKRISAKIEVTFAAIFVTASVFLWIAWTGEWVQDILGGLVFAYFFCITVRSLKQTDALRRSEWIMLGALLSANILGEVALLFLSGAVKTVVDLACYAVMYTTLLFLLVKTIRRTLRGANARGNLTLACATLVFSLSTMFMSEAWFYYPAYACSLIALPLMLIALKRGVVT